MTKLPIGYRLGMLSIIKEMVRSGSVNYYHHIFNENKHEIKPFVHSTYIKNIALKENEIHGETSFNHFKSFARIYDVLNKW